MSFGTDSFCFREKKKREKVEAAGRPVWPKESKESKRPAADQRQDTETSPHKKKHRLRA
jgi:hypothetical protein